MALKNNPKKNKELLLKALERSLGLVTPACKEVGLDRTTFYNYYNNDPEFKAAVDDINEILTDFVENQLFKKIKDGDTQSILFFIRYKGKKRGYTDSINIDGNLNTNVQIIKLIGPDGNNNETH